MMPLRSMDDGQQYRDMKQPSNPITSCPLVPKKVDPRFVFGCH